MSACVYVYVLQNKQSTNSCHRQLDVCLTVHISATFTVNELTTRHIPHDSRLYDESKIAFVAVVCQVRWRGADLKNLSLHLVTFFFTTPN